MVISASLQAWGGAFPVAMLTSICRSIVTICSGLYLLIGMTRFSSKWILSHSTWYKFRRSGHQVSVLGHVVRAPYNACSQLSSIDNRRRTKVKQFVERGGVVWHKWHIRFCSWTKRE